MSAFKQKVLQAVESIPYAKVASYGQIALYVGFPRGARQVGWVLRSTDRDSTIQIPWWRVLNNSGRITIKGNLNSDAESQKKLLMAEGVEVDEDYCLDIDRFRWRPTQEQTAKFRLAEKYVDEVIEKYRI